MAIEKPKLDRLVLENQGITFSEKVYCPDRPQHGTTGDRLPEHVESIRKALLHFRALVPKSRWGFFKREAKRFSTVAGCKNDGDCSVEPPKSAYLKHVKKGTESMIASMIDDNHKVAKEAWKTARSNVMEESWSSFMSKHIFKQFDEVHVEATDYDYLFDHWTLETGALWNEADLANYDPSITRPTAPKPDRTYAFPIHERPDLLVEGFRDDESVTNFSLEVLGELLCSPGLISAPISGLSNWVKNSKFPMFRHHLMCFPWAVVELKHSRVPQSEINFAYCQAANAASSALTLFEKLFQLAGRADDLIPPVVTFTCIGPFIRVWLAYSSTPGEKSRCHRMMCIWSGTLTTTWGVIATRKIIKNMLFWASRILRPQLSSCISQIRRNKRLDRSDPVTSQDTLGSTNIPTPETLSVQQPLPTEETVVAEEDNLPQESNSLQRHDLLQENVTQQGVNLVQETNSDQGQASLSSEGVVDAETSDPKHMSPRSPIPDSGKTNPKPETETPREDSVPQSLISDTSKSTSGENTSEASSQGLKRPPGGLFPTPFGGYESGSGPTNQPTPSKINDPLPDRSLFRPISSNPFAPTETDNDTGKASTPASGQPGSAGSDALGLPTPNKTDDPSPRRSLGVEYVSPNTITPRATANNTGKATPPPTSPGSSEAGPFDKPASTRIFGQPTPDKANNLPPHNSPGFGSVSPNPFTSTATSNNTWKATPPQQSGSAFGRYGFLFGQPTPMETTDKTRKAALPPTPRYSFGFGAFGSKSAPTDSQQFETPRPTSLGSSKTKPFDTPAFSEHTQFGSAFRPPFSFGQPTPNKTDDPPPQQSTPAGKNNNLDASDGTISEHDADDRLASESADSYTNDSRDKNSDLASEPRTIDSRPVLESHEIDETRAAYRHYHVYRFSDTLSDRSNLDDREDEPGSSSESSSSSSSSAEQSLYSGSEYEPSEAATSASAEDYEDIISSASSVTESQAEDFDEDDEVVPSSLSSSSLDGDDDDDEESESEDYESSITESNYDESSDSFDSSESEESETESNVLEEQQSMLDESAIDDMFRRAARALRGPEWRQLQTIRDKVDSLPRVRLHNIIWSVLCTIKRACTSPNTVPKREYKHFIGVVSEAIQEDIGLGDDGTDGFDLDEMFSIASISSKKWRSINQGIDEIRKTDKGLLKELCWEAIACMDSSAVFEALWTDSEQQLSERKYLAIGKAALELFYSQPVKRRRRRR